LQHSLIALYYIYDRYIVYKYCNMWSPNGHFTFEEVMKDEHTYIQWVRLNITPFRMWAKARHDEAQALLRK